jgi:hypothetical protein
MILRQYNCYALVPSTGTPHLATAPPLPDQASLLGSLSNPADGPSRRRDYEDEAAEEDKSNENLNLRKWILIESKNTLKSKNEKKKNTYFFQSINHRHVALSNANNNSSKTLKTIDETSRSNYFTNNNVEKTQKSQSLRTHKTSRRKRNRYDCEKNFGKKKIFQVIVSKYQRDFENASTRKRNERWRSCFEKLNKKCLKQKSDVQRFVLKVSHSIIYFATIWFVCATSTIFYRKSIDEARQRKRKCETS